MQNITNIYTCIKCTFICTKHKIASIVHECPFRVKFVCGTIAFVAIKCLVLICTFILKVMDLNEQSTSYNYDIDFVRNLTLEFNRLLSFVISLYQKQLYITNCMNFKIVSRIFIICFLTSFNLGFYMWSLSFFACPFFKCNHCLSIHVLIIHIILFNSISIFCFNSIY